MRDEDATHLDLFSGIGGFGLAAAWAGFRTVAFCERDKFCREILAKWWPRVPIAKNVTRIRPEKYLGICLITGGDPYQENSNARQTFATESPSLGAEFLRIIAGSRPRFVLRENPAHVRADAPWPWWKFRAGLEELGYVVLPIRLRSCCLGAEHQRERLFLLAHLSDALPARLQRHELGKLASADFERHAEREIEAVRHLAQQARRHTAPAICRSVDGIPRRMDRLKALGNAVDPWAAYVILKLLRKTL